MIDVETLMQNKQLVIDLIRKDNSKEDAFQELPELNDKSKGIGIIWPRKKKSKGKKGVIKGEMSSESDDEKFLSYNFASKV